MAVLKLHSMVTLTALLQYFGHTLALDTKKLHHHMSPEDLKATFHVERHDQVPEYEVVHPQAATPYSSYQADNIGPPPENLTDIWSVLSGLSKKVKDSDWERDRRRPDNLEEIEEEDENEGKKRVVKLKAFGKDLELKLKETTGLFGKGVRVWETIQNTSTANGVEFRELPQEEDVGVIYQDEKNQAAILVHSDKDGKLLLEGTIGHDLVVKPVPASIRHLVRPPDDEMFLDDEDIQNDVTMDSGAKIRERRDLEGLYHRHIIYKRSGANEEEDFSDYALMEPDHLSKKNRRRRSASNRNKREAPYVIFPEILVIVDYDGYRLHGGDNVQIKRYFVSFWNGVDLRYKLLKGPKIRISIAGIIISRGRDATPYLERNRVGRDAIDSAAALTDMGKYLFRERRLPVYDIAVAITKYDMCRRRKGGRCTKGTAGRSYRNKLDMCRRQFANDACNRGTAGFAYVGGACVVNKRLEKVNSVAIIEDTGGFSGIIVAAHEVGHLLGAVHDGSPPPSYLGGPGAEKCRWEDGFIMSDLRHTEKGFKWSSCSVASFHHFLNGDTATCLFNSPHEDESLPRVLPGKLLTLDAQCRKDRGTSACFKDDRVCAQLFCFDAGSGYCVAYRPAAEGSPCGDGQYCINGKCVAEHENIIPDYSQNTPSYLRRDDFENLATQPRPVYAFPNSTTQRIYPNEIATTAKPAPQYQTTARPPTTKFDFNSFFSNFNNRRTTLNPQKLFNEFFRTSTTESPDQKAYREFYATSTTESPDVVAYREFYRTSTTESPEVIAQREYYRTSTTESPEVIAQREYYRTSTTENPEEVARREFYRTSTTESPDVVAYREFYRTSTVQPQYYSPVYSTVSTRSPFDPANIYQRSTTKNPYDFSEYDPNSPNYFRRVVDTNSLGSEVKQRQVSARRRRRRRE